MLIGGVEEGHLVLFDKSKENSWDEKIYSEKINDKITV